MLSKLSFIWIPSNLVLSAVYYNKILTKDVSQNNQFMYFMYNAFLKICKKLSFYGSKKMIVNVTQQF